MEYSIGPIDMGKHTICGTVDNGVDSVDSVDYLCVKELHSFGKNLSELIKNAHFFYIDEDGNERGQDKAIDDHRAIEQIYYEFKKLKGVQS